MTLSGVVSNHKPGESVTIFYQPYPQPSLIARVTVLTATGGTFSFIVAPRIADHLPGFWKGAFATPTTMQVMPRLVLGRTMAGWCTSRGRRSPAARCSSSA